MSELLKEALKIAPCNTYRMAGKINGMIIISVEL